MIEQRYLSFDAGVNPIEQSLTANMTELCNNYSVQRVGVYYQMGEFVKYLAPRRVVIKAPILAGIARLGRLLGGVDPHSKAMFLDFIKEFNSRF